MTFAWEPAPVVGGAYTDDTRPWSVQDTVNWLPVRIERPGGRSESMLRCAPGASVFCIPGPVAPVRGLHDVEGKLFAVIGTSLFQITPTGVAIPRGTIPGVGRVSMTHNQITGGNELVIANGYSGYVYNTKTEANAQQITDDGFPGFKVCDYVDSYIVGVEPAGRYWFTSDLAAATSYNTLDRAEAESQPDRIVGLIVNHREVFVLGERTGEFFRNTGAATGTFQRADGTEMDVGCASAHTIQKLDNSVFWLGNDGWVYRLNGYSPQRISTGPLEQAISRCNMAQAFAFTFEDRGHKIYYLTFPDGMTWGYDVSTGEWTRRESFGFDLWRMNCLVRWNKQWIAGDFVNGKLYRLDWDMPWENGEVIERRRVAGVLHGNQNRITLDAVELVFDTGADDVGPGDLFPGQPAGPAISGAAPDGAAFAPYAGYTYSLTPGDAPIVRTEIISGSLPAGLTWNEATATISATTPTVAGSFTITLRTTDANGLYATLMDTISIVELVSIDTEWRYLIIPIADDTDYSPPEYDDSAWLTGGQPFGDLRYYPQAGEYAHAFDPRFPEEVVTFVDQGYIDIWMRCTITASAETTIDATLKVAFDGPINVFLNGVEIASHPGGPNDNHGWAVAFPLEGIILNAGDNIIAIKANEYYVGGPPSAGAFYIAALLDFVP